MHRKSEEELAEWPKESRAVAEQIIGKYGEPDGMSKELLMWHENDPWLLTLVSKRVTPHDFPMPHSDIVEQYIRYDVPIDKVDQLAAFDGSVTVKRTEGLLGARCHDEEANFLAINLAHKIVANDMSVKEAKEAYVQSLIDFRQGKPTPYMEGLQFETPQSSGDKGKKMISKEELESYKKE